jgi:hypothetical protein
MIKLFNEPRVITEIKDKPIKKRCKKDRVLVKPTYTLIYESDKTNVSELFRVYKESPFRARVKFFNKGKNNFSFNRVVLFEFENGEFEISHFINYFGISTTNKIYSSQKKISSVIYRKEKFWYTNNKKIQPLTFELLRGFIGDCENISVYVNKTTERILGSKIFQYFKKRFHWFKTVYENKVSYRLTFNKIVKDEIFKLKDMSLAVLGVHHKLGEIILSSKRFGQIVTGGKKGIVIWRGFMKILDGVEHLTEEMLNSEYFYDTCRMARILGRRVNCRWSLNRLKTEHDIWAREITNILLESELEVELNVRPIFKAFANFSGFKLLSTNKDMLAEGMVQNHCVGTYMNKVDRGACAIYHVDGYTLELSHVTESFKIKESIDGQIPQYRNVEKKILKNVQFKGKYNINAPEELVKLVNKKLIDFMVSEEMGLVEAEEKGYVGNYNNVHMEVNELGVDIGLF